MAVPQEIPTVINDIVTENISYSSSWAMSSWKTFIAETFDGSEKRNIDWLDARGKGTVVMSGREQQSDIQPLVDLHANTQGRAIPFKFRDPMDSSGTDEAVGTGDNVLVAFQLTKTYTVVSGNPYIRKITKPNTGSVVPKFGGTPFGTEGVDWTVDYTTGIITFTVPPSGGTVITADFTYTIPVRFDSDQLSVSFDNFNQYSLSIGIVEVL